MKTYAYGFPRLGKKREFKSAIEDYWKGNISEDKLISWMFRLEKQRLSEYKKYVDLFPKGEFTFYDNMFDMALMFGVYKAKGLNRYFSFGRGRNALEMKKYFNTNYHYLVPVIKKGQKFRVAWNKPLVYHEKSSQKRKPVAIMGPYTFLKLSRVEGSFDKTFNELCAAYKKLFVQFEKAGITSVHMEDPAFCLDVTAKEIKAIVKNYKKMISRDLEVNLITYYDSVDFLKELYKIPFAAIGLDFVSGESNIANLEKTGFPEGMNLVCGIVDGRNVGRSDIMAKVRLLKRIKKTARINDDRIYVSNSAPLFHLPISLDNETNMSAKHKNILSFAKERLYELGLIPKAYSGDTKEAELWSKAVKESQPVKPGKVFDTVSLKESVYSRRKKVHQEELDLPFFPTTTIGSFPQDSEVRKMRLDYRKGRLSKTKYKSFIGGRIKDLVKKEEEIGLDVLVHGEFERTDMVEFFAQKLDGFVTTESGWIISYGTRVYRPPIVVDKIGRTKPLTAGEITHADHLTHKPVKGIFTGPVTILAWGFCVRTDPIYKVAFELAKALNEEAKDLVKKGIKIIQVDEPAIKEFSPIKKRMKKAYFGWAIRSFNMVTKLPERVQIHTHMCYSEFAEIIDWILKMNFDVITIETAREKGKVLETFFRAGFKRDIGPGLWDIHSKYPAEERTIKTILNKSIKFFGPEHIWMNPDCGLKTRNWEETELSLERIVKIAKQYRKRLLKGSSLKI
ncbi:MAG: 5-methyltetrahydropteroyltriglutamate--homocysteine S-methyltransferase [Candidatus Omnitrophota bacterium]|nr:5-methyltetrahydropteroyltriglutamate--homocysteine S-methyltransferase [Candidatus Omnitrophota bacterium]